MNKSKPSTGLDVARLAGVSKSAVSRAYNGGYVAPDVRERIFEAARKLRYRPSNAARALSTSKSNLVGLAITALDNLFYPGLVDCLTDQLSSAGYRCVLFETHGRADLEPMLDELLGFRLDGVILASTSFATRVAAECAAHGIPVIMLINIDLSGQIAGVSADNAHGARAVADHFIRQGRRRIGVINGLTESSASVERTAQFREAIMEGGLPAPRVVCGHYTFDGTCTATRELLTGDNAVEAIFCVTDLMALACVQQVRLMGLEPGRDIAVAGFDDVPIARWPAFDLTTYAVPVEDMVATCVSRLVGAIQGQPLAPDLSRLPGKLVVRGSTRG